MGRLLANTHSLTPGAVNESGGAKAILVLFLMQPIIFTYTMRCFGVGGFAKFQTRETKNFSAETMFQSIQQDC